MSVGSTDAGGNGDGNGASSIVESWRGDQFAAYGSVASKIPSLTNVRKNTASTLIAVTNDATNGIIIEALVACHATFSFWARNGAAVFFEMGLSLNGGDGSINIDALAIDKVLALAHPFNGDGLAASCTISIEMAIGDKVRPHTNADTVYSGTTLNMGFAVLAVS